MSNPSGIMNGLEDVLFTPEGKDREQDGSHRNGGIVHIECGPLRSDLEIQEVDNHPDRTRSAFAQEPRTG